MFYADLHVHSKYSRATSRDADLEHLALWARKKGLTVVATGDFTHPAWLAELKEKLVPAEPGLFRLRDDLQREVDELTPEACQQPVRFVLQVEISTIYKKDGRTRKIHHVVFVPGFEQADAFVTALSRIGNLKSDGRPILGLDSRHLLEIVLESGDGCYLVPAHVWTPWFALFGSQSGFDALEECYGDLSEHIFALETGLSSDPPMNWRWSALDRYTLVSNSDAHSPAKLAREACVFDTELDYFAIRRALETREGYGGTIEFFPEEGKYHLDGHRKCGVRLTPRETRELDGRCPVCGKPVTVGVMHRVEALADRPEGERPETAASFRSLIPLPELIAELRGVGEKSKTVQREFEQVLRQVGPELFVLEQAETEELERAGFPLLAEAVRRVREGRVIREAGFDGQYGVIRVFEPGELEQQTGTRQLFDNAAGKQNRSSRRKEAATRQKLQSNETDALTATAAAGEPEDKEPTNKQAETAGLAALSVAQTKPVDGQTDTNHSHGRKNILAASQQAQGSPFAPSVQNIRQDHAQPPSQNAETEITTTIARELLSGLDADQRRAVLHVNGPLAILAGPGTGKTRTLTHRVAFLVAEGLAEPEQCLTLTFSRRAAGELKERLKRLIPGQADRVPVQTFHSLGLRLVTEQRERLKLPEQFRLISEPERLQLVADLWELSPRQAARRLKQLKTLKWQHYAAAWNLSPDHSPKTQEKTQPFSADERSLLEAYEQRLRADGWLDFDDLIFLSCRVLAEASDVREQYKRRWPWISVDEFQDTDAVQYQLLRLLAPDNGHVCVIGDPDQSIYGFRGADARAFERFLNDFPSATVVHLTTNYRSSRSITTAALQAIQPDSLVPGRTLKAVLEEMEPVTIQQCASERAEAEFVVHTIERLLGGHAFFSMDSGRVGELHEQSYSFDDFAVLVRTEAQLPPLLEAFERSGMPFQTFNHSALTEQTAVRLLVQKMYELLKEPRERPLPTTAQALLEAATTELQAELQKNETDEHTLEAHSLRHWHDELLRLADLWQGSPAEFLNELTTASTADLWDPRANRISLLTLHAAKGLEFRVVFLVGCEDGLLPLKWGETAEPETLAEERRLLFVGMTRARERLFLTHAKRRKWQGKVRERRLSPFLTETLTLETVKQLLSSPNPKKKKRQEDTQRRLFE